MPTEWGQSVLDSVANSTRGADDMHIDGVPYNEWMETHRKKRKGKASTPASTPAPKGKDMPDEYLAMLQGMDPGNARGMAAKLRGQDMFGKVYASSLTPNAQRLGKADSADAMSKIKHIGLARAKKAAQEEADLRQSDRWATTDQQLEEQRAQTQENWEATMEFNKLKLEEQNQLKRDLQEMKTQETLKETRKAVTSMSKELVKANVPKIDASFDALGKVLKPYMNADGSLKSNIPGAGATGVGPQFLLTSEGKTVRQTVANIRNQYLQMMSGAAVTDPEAARLYEQIGIYLGGSDEEIIYGLQLIQDVANRNRDVIYQGYSDAVIEEWERRGSGRGEPSTSGVAMGNAQSYLDAVVEEDL